MKSIAQRSSVLLAANRRKLADIQSGVARKLILIVEGRGGMPETDKAEVLFLLRQTADLKASWRTDYAEAIQKLLALNTVNGEQITKLVASVRDSVV